MGIFIAVLFIITGSLGILRPGIYYNSKKLNAHQIARNKRIWKRCGIGLVLLGILDLILDFFAR